MFFYVIINYFLLNVHYEQIIYNSGINGLGDDIYRLFIKFKWLQDKNKDYFAAFCYLLLNLLLFIFIAYSKLDYIFNITSIFSIIFLPLFVSLFAFLFQEIMPEFKITFYIFSL